MKATRRGFLGALGLAPFAVGGFVPDGEPLRMERCPASTIPAHALKVLAGGPIITLGIDHADPGGSSTWRSDDNGETWARVSLEVTG